MLGNYDAYSLCSLRWVNLVYHYCAFSSNSFWYGNNLLTVLIWVMPLFLAKRKKKVSFCNTEQHERGLSSVPWAVRLTKHPQTRNSLSTGAWHSWFMFASYDLLKIFSFLPTCLLRSLSAELVYIRCIHFVYTISVFLQWVMPAWESIEIVRTVKRNVCFWKIVF